MTTQNSDEFFSRQFIKNSTDCKIKTKFNVLEDINNKFTTDKKK